MVYTKVNGTLINYYFHCRRQCYLHGNRINMEDNSEYVKIGKAIHDEKGQAENAEIALENIRLDKLTNEYLTEVKKSDADVEAAKWQLLFYLKILRDKGIVRKGKLEFIEKNKTKQKVIYVELNEETELLLEKYCMEIQELLLQDRVPSVVKKSGCKKCAYYEYCYI